MSFVEELTLQRWDDHRYYHHDRINQSLHLFSALCFITSYVLLWVEPAFAVMIGWLLAMPSRQIGHFFFEPHTYDHANRASHEFKEAVKVGYNLRRKVVLLSAWALLPGVMFVDPTFAGFVPPPDGWFGYVRNLSVVWLALGALAVAGRTLQLCLTKGVQTGLVWCTKILTDPFHDVLLYHKAPIYVWRGDRFDPIVRRRAA